MIIKNSIFGLILLMGLPLSAQQTNKNKGLSTINESIVKAQLEFLASDWMEGRETGTAGAYMAADYIASMFKVYGLKPGGDMIPVQYRRGMTREEYQSLKPGKSYFQNFQLVEYGAGTHQELSVISTKNGSVIASKFHNHTDFSVRPGQTAQSAKSEVIFVGYGISDLDNSYDDFKGIDVTNKVIVRLKGFPGHMDPYSEAFKKFSKFGPDRYGRYQAKNKIASEKGVLAIIEYDPYNMVQKAWSANVPFRYETNGYEGDEPFRSGGRKRLSIPNSSLGNNLLIFQVSAIVFYELIAEIDFKLLEFEKASQNGEKTSIPHELPDKSVEFNTSIESRIIQARNVVGIIEGKKKDQCIVLGAHYDHLGIVRQYIYNGADDNASGTVGIMTIAKAMIATGEQPEYTMVFCAWTGEEKGLLGSAYFADNPVIQDIKCYMNYDMISRVALDDPDKNKCDFTFTNTVSVLKELTEKHIDDYKINLDMKYKGSEMPVGGSDFSSFSRKGIPIFLLHGKFTPDYHQYTDHSEKAELPYMTDIIRVGFLNLFELANNYKW